MLIGVVGMAMVVLVPLIWGLLRKEQGLPMFGAPTVAELEDPSYAADADRRSRDHSPDPMFLLSNVIRDYALGHDRRPRGVRRVVRRAAGPRPSSGSVPTTAPRRGCRTDALSTRLIRADPLAMLGRRGARRPSATGCRS